MTVEEIFNKLASHMAQGIIFHDEMINVYNFLYLKGYTMCQMYHYLEESYNYKCLSLYYTNHYYKLLQIENIERPKLIPETWYKYTTQDVDTGTKKNCIKELINKWIEWEHLTKKLYEQMRQELYLLGELDAALFIDKYIKDVSSELQYAKKQLIKLETINYDIVEIIHQQKGLYKKYKNKLRW